MYRGKDQNDACGTDGVPQQFGMKSAGLDFLPWYPQPKGEIIAWRFFPSPKILKMYWTAGWKITLKAYLFETWALLTL